MIVRWIFLIALLVRTACAVAIFASNPERLVGEVCTYTDDTCYYDHLAVNLWRHGVYSASLGPPYTPDMLRVPGYPLFLAAVYMIFGHLARMVVFWQLVLSALTCALLWRLGERLTGERRIATIAALLLTLDIASILMAQELLSETLFTLLLLLNMAALWEYRLGRRAQDLVAAGAWLGLAALVRSEAAPFALVEVVLVWAWVGQPWRRSLRAGLMLLGPVLLLVTPWVGRNWYQFHVPALTSLGANVVFSVAAPIVSAIQGVPLTSVVQQYRRRIAEYRCRNGLESLEDSAVIALKLQLTREVLAEHPLAFLKLQVMTGTGIWLPRIPAFVRLLGYSYPTFTERWEVWRHEGWLGVWNLYFDRWVHYIPWPVTSLCAAWVIFLTVIYASAVRGFLVLSGKKQWAPLALLGITLLFFLVPVQMVTLVKTPRYLVPLMPYLMVVAAAGMASGSSWKNNNGT